MKLEGLTIGRVVHFLLQLEGMVGTVEYAAIVSKDYSGGALFAEEGAMTAEDTHGLVRLHVFTENTVTVIDHIPYSAEKLPNTWHWPEKA